MLIILGQFFLCLSILIVLHEAGHFFAARMFNTKVEKFYLFFNPWFSLFKKKIGDTTYGIGWLPLGGYVKIAGMIDESMDQEQMKKPAKEWEFRSKPRWQRLIIMLGGVTVNFILAFFIYVFMFGYWGERLVDQKPLSVYSSLTKEWVSQKNYDLPYEDLAQLQKNTVDNIVASFPLNFPLKSGDKIISIDGRSVVGLCAQDVFLDLILWGEKDVVVSRNGEKKSVTLNKEHIGHIVNRRVNIKDTPFKIKVVSNEIEVVNAEGNLETIKGPAKAAGLKAGDVLFSINSKEISGASEFISFLQKNPEKKISIGFIRDGKIKKTSLIIPPKQKDGIVKIGVAIDRGEVNQSLKKHSFLSAIPAALIKTKTEIKNYIGQFGLIFQMDGGAKNLGGFMMIGSLFGSENEEGRVYWDWENFWKWTAFISIMLAIVNLLPIPALDGGHVVILLIEMVMGRDINPKILGYIQMVGLVLLFGLFILANVNDVIRFFF